MSTVQNKNAVIVSIGSIPLIMTLGNSMLIPVFPNMKTALNLSQMQVSLTITVFSITAAIFIPFFGYLSDRFTRKIVMIPALILYGIGGLLAGFGSSLFAYPYVWILIGRMIQGLGAAGTAPIAMALTGDLFKGSEQSRVLGIFEASNGMGKVLSPIMGSIIALITWYAVFFAFPAFCLISVILAWVYIKEKKNYIAPPPFSKYMKSLLYVFKSEGRWLLTTYLAGGTCLFTLFGILFYLSDILEDIYDIDGILKGFILAIPLLAMVVTSYVTGSKIGKKFATMKWLMLIGFFIMTLSYGLLILFKNIIPFLIILALGSIGSGLVLPCVNSLITGSVDKKRRGFVSSLYGSVRFVGVAIGPPIFARLMEWSRTGMFAFIAIYTVVIGLLILFFIRIKRKDDREQMKVVHRYTYI